jgi:hypothetical protein
MKQFLMVIVLLTLTAATVSCSFTVNVPEVKTIDTQNMEINEPAPTDVAGASLKIEMGAGKLNIRGGGAGLVEGTIHYNVFGWAPEISRGEGNVTIHQKPQENIRIPSDRVVNEWDLLLGTFPTDLTIYAGAYEGRLDLSGLALTKLDISDGASKATVEFNSPNPEEMESLTYRTGASQVELYSLANANTGSVNFDGGAGDYRLDFSGDLKKDMDVQITSGVSKITVVIPAGVPAVVTVRGGLNNVSPRGTWSISGSVYEKTGTGPKINITVDMGVGSLELIGD